MVEDNADPRQDILKLLRFRDEQGGSIPQLEDIIDALGLPKQLVRRA